MQLGWRAWARRQWPLAVILLVLLAGDLISAKGLPFIHPWQTLPGAVLLAALALIAPRRPVAASLGTAAVLLLSSVLLRLLDAQTLPFSLSLLATELGALLAVIVAVVRAIEPGRGGAGAEQPGPGLPRWKAAALVALLLAVCLAGMALRPSEQSPFEELPWDAILPALAIATGLYLRSRDHDLARATRAAVTAAQQRERVSLARELHDVVAHHIGGMVVQAQAAQAVAVTDPGAAARVLPTIEGAGTDALSAMRRMVAALRDTDADDGDPPLTRTTDLTADLRAVTATPAGGTPVRLAVELVESVPDEVATSVLRLVQESVTNARRHAAGARQIAVLVRAEGGIAQVEVRDDGHPGPGAAYGGGYGLVGMRERVQLLGGRFSAGHTEGGGWQVLADVPLRDPGA